MNLFIFHTLKYNYLFCVSNFCHYASTDCIHWLLVESLLGNLGEPDFSVREQIFLAHSAIGKIVDWLAWFLILVI